MLPIRWSALARHGLLGTTLVGIAARPAAAESCDYVADSTVGFVFGSKSEVERIERYHREPATREPGIALFAERSLFRD